MFTLFYNVYWEKFWKIHVYVGNWPCDLAYPRCPPGLHPKSVFAHQSVRKREKKKQSVVTRPLSSSGPLHLFRHSSNLFDGCRWHGAAYCGTVSSASGRSGRMSCPLNFGSPVTMAPCDVRKTFKFFLGLCHWCLRHCTPKTPSLCASRTKPSNNCF